MEEILKEYVNLLKQKRYSQNTRNIYYGYFKDFCIHFKNKDLSNITAAQINSYVLELINSKNISISQRNQRINAIKFYYEKVLVRKRRHSFTTHLLEQVTDLRYIQGLLGHNSSKTTEIYTYASKKAIYKIKNPVDDFFKGGDIK